MQFNLEVIQHATAHLSRSRRRSHFQSSFRACTCCPRGVPSKKTCCTFTTILGAFGCQCRRHEDSHAVTNLLKAKTSSLLLPGIPPPWNLLAKCPKCCSAVASQTPSGINRNRNTYGRHTVHTFDSSSHPRYCCLHHTKPHYMEPLYDSTSKYLRHLSYVTQQKNQIQAPINTPSLPSFSNPIRPYLVSTASSSSSSSSFSSSSTAHFSTDSPRVCGHQTALPSLQSRQKPTPALYDPGFRCAQKRNARLAITNAKRRERHRHHQSSPLSLVFS